jgi:hypothetical protein
MPSGIVAAVSRHPERTGCRHGSLTIFASPENAMPVPEAAGKLTQQAAPSNYCAFTEFTR